MISPLLSLMEDQTNFLLAQGISAGSIGEDKAANAKILTKILHLNSVGKWSVQEYHGTKNRLYHASNV